MPSPMDYMAHELHDPMASSSMQANNTSDVLAMQNMLAAAEQQEAEHRRAQQTALAADIYDEYEPPKHQPPMGKAPDISGWLDDISKKDEELRKNGNVTRMRSGLPPVRNADKCKKKVQVGASDVEKQKAEARGDSAPKGPSSKQQKYYSYDYFKEWDKFDVDKEIARIEEEEKKKDEYKSFSKPAADVESPEDVHDSTQTYKVEDMTPLEKRVAAKREKEKGNECMKAGEINAAVGFYSKALELVPGDHLVLGNRAQAYIGIKCFYQAELDCDTALAIEPSYHKARYRRGVAREDQGKLVEAKEDYERILAEQPEHTLARQKLAVLEVKLRKKQEAEEAAYKAEEERKRYDAAPRRKIQIQEFDEDDDDDDDGMDAEALKKAREAVKHKEEKEQKPASRFTEIEESEEKKSRKLKSDAEERILKLAAAREQKEKGNERFKGKDLDGALRHYSRGLDLLPADDSEERHLILCNKALVLLQQNKFEQAEADCTEAIKVNAKWAKAWHRRGVAKYKASRLDEAMEDFEQALKLEPNSKSTIDEIKTVRDLQLAKRREAAPPARKARVQIEEVETDSEDDDVVVVSSPNSQSESGPQCDQKSASPPKSGPGAATKKVSILEVDDDDDSDAEVEVKHAVSEDEGELMDDDVAVSVAPSGSSSTGSGKVVAIEELDDDSDEEPEVSSSTSSVGVPPEVSGAGKAATKVAIEEVDSEDEESEVVVPIGAAASSSAAAGVGKTSVVETLSKIVVVEDEDDSDEEQEVGSAAYPEQPESVKRAAWEESPDVDAAKLSAAKKIKEEADAAFKKALFEQGAILYTQALDALGYEEDFVPEQTICFLNRAACYLQVREYGQVIADCGQVLDWDPDNVKAYLRRGLAYEGNCRFTKAAADMREAISIEFASGGLTALGNKAKECLERCKKNEPELRAIPIPVREKIVPRANAASTHRSLNKHATSSAVSASVPATRSTSEGSNFIAAKAFSGSKPGYAFKQGDQGLGYYKDVAAAPPPDGGDDDIDIIMSQTGVDRARAEAALKKHKDAAGAILAIEDEKEGKPSPSTAGDSKSAGSSFNFAKGAAREAAKEAAAQEAQKDAPTMADRIQISRSMEAEDHKNKGNAAFKAGKYRSAIMHYSASIDLDDNNPTYYTNLAAAHNALKDYENGVKMALAARKADPTYVKAIYRHAQALQGLGKLRDALKAYEEGLEIMPGSSQMAEGRTQVSKAIRDSESSEVNALAKLKALKEAEAKKKAAEAEAKATEQAAAKAAQPTATGAKTKSAIAIGLTAGPKSGADIKKAMRNMRKDMPGLFNYLVQCVPEQMPKLLSSGVEEEELVQMVRAIAEHGAGNAPQQSFALLEGLAKVPRVPIVTAMLDRKDSKILEALLLRLHPSKAIEVAGDGGIAYDVDQWARLRQAYGF